MSFDFEAIKAAAREEAEALIDDAREDILSEDQWEDLRDKAVDLSQKIAEQGVKALLDPDDALRYRRNVEFLLRTLENEATVVRIRAEKFAQQAAKQTLFRILGTVISAAL